MKKGVTIFCKLVVILCLNLDKLSFFYIYFVLCEI